MTVVSGEITAKVAAYLEHHVSEVPQTIPCPLPYGSLTTSISSWDAKFLEVEQAVLFRLLLASNYLGITSLTTLVSAKIASLMQGSNQTHNNSISPTPNTLFFYLSSLIHDSLMHDRIHTC